MVKIICIVCLMTSPDSVREKCEIFSGTRALLILFSHVDFQAETCPCQVNTCGAYHYRDLVVVRVTTRLMYM